MHAVGERVLDGVWRGCFMAQSAEYYFAHLKGLLGMDYRQQFGFGCSQETKREQASLI
jgi:hypothetical protein